MMGRGAGRGRERAPVSSAGAFPHWILQGRTFNEQRPIRGWNEGRREICSCVSVGDWPTPVPTCLKSQSYRGGLAAMSSSRRRMPSRVRCPALFPLGGNSKRRSRFAWSFPLCDTQRIMLFLAPEGIRNENKPRPPSAVEGATW